MLRYALVFLTLLFVLARFDDVTWTTYTYGSNNLQLRHSVVTGLVFDWLFVTPGE
jgi:hypothetical protein